MTGARSSSYLADEVLQCDLNRDARTEPVTVGVVTHPDRTARKHCLAEFRRDFPEVVPQLLESRPFDRGSTSAGSAASASAASRSLSTAAASSPSSTVSDSASTCRPSSRSSARPETRTISSISTSGCARTPASSKAAPGRCRCRRDSEDGGTAGLFDLDDRPRDDRLTVASSTSATVVAFRGHAVPRSQQRASSKLRSPSGRISPSSTISRHPRRTGPRD